MLRSNAPNDAKFGRAPTKCARYMCRGKFLLPGKVDQSSLNSGSKFALGADWQTANHAKFHRARSHYLD